MLRRIRYKSITKKVEIDIHIKIVEILFMDVAWFEHF